MSPVTGELLLKLSFNQLESFNDHVFFTSTFPLFYFFLLILLKVFFGEKPFLELFKINFPPIVEVSH